MIKFRRPSYAKELSKSGKVINKHSEILLSRLQALGSMGNFGEGFYYNFIKTQIYMRSINEQKPTYNILKAIFDRSIALLLILILVPVFCAISLVILITDGRPVVYLSYRMGKFGLPFVQYKFRTLKIDYGSKQTQSFNQIEHDCPNIFMAFLRDHKIDELPQLLNVLLGNMSLVGPRPVVLEEYKFLMSSPLALYRLSATPGLTGLWQVTLSKRISGRRRILRDVVYVKNRSMLLDLIILAKTVLVVVQGEKKIADIQVDQPAKLKTAA